MTNELEKLQRKGTKPTCPDCHATVLSTSQPERVTDEMLNAHIKALGDWTEPFTAERESGVAMDMDISQEDADQFNADERARLRIGYTAALAATPAVGGEARDTIAKLVCCPGGCILATCGNDACVALNPEYTMLPTADAILSAFAAPPTSQAAVDGKLEALADHIEYEQARGIDIPLSDEQAAQIVAMLRAPPASPLRGRKWRPIETVGDLVNNLLTLDQAMKVYGAYHVSTGEDRARARSLSLSRERVSKNRIRIGNDAVAYSLVIWTEPDADLIEQVRTIRATCDFMRESPQTRIGVIAERCDAILSASPPEQPAADPADVDVVWLREIDAGTDNACWVLSNRVDPTAVEFVPLMPLRTAT